MLMKSYKNVEFLDVILNLTLSFTAITAAIQLLLLIAGDPFNEQGIINLCWGISFSFMFVIAQVKVLKAVEKLKQQHNDTSSYMRQGDDVTTLMGAEQVEAGTPYFTDGE